MKCICWLGIVSKSKCFQLPENIPEDDAESKCRLVYPISCGVDRELVEILRPFLGNEENPSMLVFEVCSNGNLMLSDLSDTKISINIENSSYTLQSYVVGFNHQKNGLGSCSHVPIILVGRRLNSNLPAFLTWLLCSKVLYTIQHHEIEQIVHIGPFTKVVVIPNFSAIRSIKL